MGYGSGISPMGERVIYTEYYYHPYLHPYDHLLEKPIVFVYFL